MKVELNKTELRAVVVSIAIAANNSRGYSYATISQRIYKRFQELLGERFDFDQYRWFEKGKPSELKWSGLLKGAW